MRLSVSVLTASVMIGAVMASVPGFSQQTPVRQAAPTVVPPGAPVVPVLNKPKVQIAILLDTSGSMQGLIEQAKTQLWKIVNEFAKAQRDGMSPDIQVALYHYGTPSLGTENNYIKLLVPLSDDLDKVSAELFKLTTDGGDEFCGAVIQKAAQDLAWSKDRDAYKAIFIAGNEAFTQGGIDYKTACKEAIAKGIIVNTIFCGNQQEGMNTGWKDGAALADGSFISIDQNVQVVQIAAPQDKELAELGARINTTYVGYGSGGRGGMANQAAQDGNAQTAGGGGFGNGVQAERALTKGQAVYNNSSWDLVDAVNQKKVDLKTLKEEELPAEMKGLDEKGRQAFVDQKNKEREEIRTRIQTLGADRDKFIAEKRKEQAGENTLDAALINTVRAQATTNGLTFPK